MEFIYTFMLAAMILLAVTGLSIGVMNVVSGWFITGLGALAIAFCVGLLLLYGGNMAIAAVTLLCGWMLYRREHACPRTVKPRMRDTGPRTRRTWKKR